MGWLYKVEAVRHVRCPEYGPDAYRSDYKRLEFPFGKGKPLKTGAQALEVANAKAAELIPDASAVSVWRVTDAGNGSGRYMKEDGGLRFETTWGELEKVRLGQPAEKIAG